MGRYDLSPLQKFLKRNLENGFCPLIEVYICTLARPCFSTRITKGIMQIGYPWARSVLEYAAADFCNVACFTSLQSKTPETTHKMYPTETENVGQWYDTH